MVVVRVVEAVGSNHHRTALVSSSSRPSSVPSRRRPPPPHRCTTRMSFSRGTVHGLTDFLVSVIYLSMCLSVGRSAYTTPPTPAHTHRASIKEDMALAGVWPFSSYGPDKSVYPPVSLLPGSMELSHEELRWEFYQARLAGSNDYVRFYSMFLVFCVLTHSPSTRTRPAVFDTLHQPWAPSTPNTLNQPTNESPDNHRTTTTTKLTNIKRRTNKIVYSRAVHDASGPAEKVGNHPEPRASAPACDPAGQGPSGGSGVSIWRWWFGIRRPVHGTVRLRTESHGFRLY